jgi:hypothetical protein
MATEKLTAYIEWDAQRDEFRAWTTFRGLLVEAWHFDEDEALIDLRDAVQRVAAAPPRRSLEMEVEVP